MNIGKYIRAGSLIEFPLKQLRFLDEMVLKTFLNGSVSIKKLNVKQDKKISVDLCPQFLA